LISKSSQNISEENHPFSSKNNIKITNQSPKSHLMDQYPNKKTRIKKDNPKV
jgi:hypothetical protein